jgi:hypothetical protein
MTSIEIHNSIETEITRLLMWEYLRNTLGENKKWDKRNLQFAQHTFFKTLAPSTYYFEHYTLATPHLPCYSTHRSPCYPLLYYISLKEHPFSLIILLFTHFSLCCLSTFSDGWSCSGGNNSCAPICFQAPSLFPASLCICIQTPC